MYSYCAQCREYVILLNMVLYTLETPVCAEEKKSLGAESIGLTGVSAGNRSEFNAIYSADGSESAEGFVSVGDFAETCGSEPYYAPIGNN